MKIRRADGSLVPDDPPRRITVTRGPATSDRPRRATRQRKGQSFGWGCLPQVLGLLLLMGAWWLPAIGWIIALAVGFIFIIVGAVVSVRWICSACGNRIEKTARLCPTCRADIS